MELTVVELGADGREPLSSLFVTGDRVLGVGGRSGSPVLLCSSDGANFGRLPTPDGTGLRAVVEAGGAWWLVGESGLCLESRDRGGSWERHDLGTAGCLFDAVVGPDGRLWVCGDDGFLAAVDPSTGVSQTQPDVDGVRHYRAVLTSDGDLLLAGADGVLRTVRGGTVIRRVTVAEGVLTGAVCTPSGTWVVTGDGGTLARSTDGGATFARLDAAGDADVEGVACLVDRSVLVVGEGVLLRSTDDAATFEPVSAPVRHLWSVVPFGDGALIGAASGMVLRMGQSPWARRPDLYGGPRPLDEVFAPGPDGFLGDRLTRYLDAFPPARRPDEELPDGLLTRPWEEKSFAANYGMPMLSGHAELLRRVAARPPWDVFAEFDVDPYPLPGVPADANIFELVVARNRDLYLGTDLAELFSGAICVGSTRGGDTFHVQLAPDPPYVFQFDHAEHLFYGEPIADSLEALAFVAALARARDEALVSAAGHQVAVRTLSGRTDGNWPFELPFTSGDSFTGEGRAAARYERAQWIIEHLQFGEPDAPADDEDTAGPDGDGTLPDTLYGLWRSYLLRHDDLPRWLAVASAHPARLVRDAAVWIERLRG